MSNYNDPRWQKKRLEVMKRDEWKCVACEDERSTLHVHHMYYDGDLWAVEVQSLQTLCESCHAALGKHPKGGVFWHKSGEAGELHLVVLWCVHCGGTAFWGDSSEACVECGWSPTEIVSAYRCKAPLVPQVTWGKSINFREVAKPKKQQEYSIQWLKGMFTRVRKAGNSDNDIFAAMFPDSPVLEYVRQLSDLRNTIESKMATLSNEQQIDIVREILTLRAHIHRVMSHDKPSVALVIHAVGEAVEAQGATNG
jgi:hypothetical protein